MLKWISGVPAIVFRRPRAEPAAPAADASRGGAPYDYGARIGLSRVP